MSYASVVEAGRIDRLRNLLVRDVRYSVNGRVVIRHPYSMSCTNGRDISEGGDQI